jgi:4-hydroxybenzoate polyprenyltransferase/phosphoserine phosphatase
MTITLLSNGGHLGETLSDDKSDMAPAPAPALSSLPLVLDLDGTLTPTDTLAESVIQLIKREPLALLRLPMWLLYGRATLKDQVAKRTSLSVETLPFRQALLDYARAEKAKGRRVLLATAAHRSIAERVAAKLEIFDEVLASGAGSNLKSKTKLDAIRAQCPDGFVYAGDSSADLPIWNQADGAILVGVSARVARAVRREVPVEREFPAIAPSLRTWLRAMRVHQWAKNLLLLVPLLTGFAFLDAHKVSTICLAFAAFSLAASATYLVNDLWDLDSDRAHPRKRHRPFASASLGIAQGAGTAAFMLLVALGLAASVSIPFLLMLCMYLVLTSAYSWVLKRYVLIDVLMLSILYTLRILAGSVAVGVTTSSWLLAFSVFLFLSLALVKRCSELMTLDQSGVKSAHGRDYEVSDLAVLWPLGCGASLSAVVVFGLFIAAPETQQKYASGDLLWLAAIGLIYWVARLWIKTSRGEMHDDPLVFAVRDFGSRVTILFMLGAMLAAYFLRLG